MTLGSKVQSVDRGSPGPAGAAGAENTVKDQGAPKRLYRVAIVFPRAQPYYCKFFQHLAAHPAIELTVYFYSDLGARGTLDPGYQVPVEWDLDMWSGYAHCFPRNYAPRPDLARFSGIFHPSLIRDLSPSRYDVVVMHGWWGATTWMTLAALFVRRMPVLIYSDKNVIDWHGGWRQSVRNGLLRAIFSQVRAFTAIGKRNAEFYRSLGIPQEKIFATPLAVDNDFFQREWRRLQPQRATLRAQAGIPADAVVILSISRLLPWKGILHLITAFSVLRDDEHLHLVIAGDGPQRAELEAFVSSQKIPRVHFVGFQNYTQVPVYYAMSDVFVLPSFREPWGCVVSEAMNFELPIVASRDGGAVGDLVEHGANGLLFDYGNVEQLAGHLRYLASNPEVRRRMGGKSAAMVANWNFDKGVEGFLAALQFVDSQHRSHAASKLAP
jgi:glycosyltransferase involved in cell wall biosynthesis